MLAETARIPGSILMTVDVVGGVWTYGIQLSAALARHGVQVILAAMGGRPTAAQCNQVQAWSNVTLVTRDLRMEWMEEPWDDVRSAGDWLLSLEAQFHPNLIHLNHFAHGDLPWRAPAIVVGHSCVLSWWEAVHSVPAPLLWDRYRDRVRSGLKAAQSVVAPTQAMLDALTTHYGPFANSVVIPNGLASQHDPAVGKKEIIFTAGRLWDQAKNICGLGRIANSLPWPILAAGSQGDAAPPAGLEYLGQLSETQMRDMMSRASIYALPALYEPFGLSVLEAAQSGCALVLGDIPSLRENWSGAALFVEPRSDEDIQHALLSLIDDFILRRRLGEAALKRANAFSPARMAESYLELYRSVLARNMVPVCA